MERKKSSKEKEFLNIKCCTTVFRNTLFEKEVIQLDFVKNIEYV
jgi:hypothetical protein